MSFSAARLRTTRRGLRRGRLRSCQRVSIAYERPGLTIRAGKHFIRWGKTDIPSPTHRFAPDRGLADAFMGRIGYALDSTRSVAFEAAVRRNGGGLWARFEYSKTFGRHWRATAAFTLIRGAPHDFLGQYRRNSHALLVLRYSF